MEKPQFVYTLFIATTAEKLWQALTTAEFTQQYWGGRRHETDWQVGSPVKIYKPVRITHDEFAPDANIVMAAMGWMAILNNLKTLLETGKPLPYAWRG
jgi:hypothetical protein